MRNIIEPEKPLSELSIFERAYYIALNMSLIPATCEAFDSVCLEKQTLMPQIKSLEQHFRIFSYPVSRKSNFQQFNDPDGIRTICNTTVVYRFVNVDNPDDYFETMSVGCGHDFGDKAPEKALIQADLSALKEVYKIGYPSDIPSLNSSLTEKEEALPTDFALNEEEQIEQTQNYPSEEKKSRQISKLSFPVTLEDAMAFIVPSGNNKGKTIGEVWESDPANIIAISQRDYSGEKYAALKRAAEIVLASKQQ